MGIFSWLFPSKAEETVAERVLPPGLEEPKSAEELAFESKYNYFRLPDNIDSKQLLKIYNECIADIRTAKDPARIIKINYCAIECLNAIFKYYYKMANKALERNECYLAFYVLKMGLSPINLSALTVPEAERVSQIIKIINSVNIPEELKFFKVIVESGVIRDVDIRQLTRDELVKIHDFFKIYNEIFSLLSNEARNQYGEIIFGGIGYSVYEFIKKAEQNLILLERSAGRDIEIFREDYLCHVAYGGEGGVCGILNTRLFFERKGGLWFFINKVHSGGTTNPAFICCLADVLQEAKERGLNFAIVSEGGGEFVFITKYNLFYDKKESRYLTFTEIKNIIKTERYAAVIYHDPTLKDNRLRAPGVCILDKPVGHYAAVMRRSAASFKPQYAIYSIQKVDRGTEDPRRQMFNSVYAASLYLMTTTEGKQILRSMLDAQR